MSKSPGNRTSLGNWAMVDSKGELMSDDNGLESSESTNESVTVSPSLENTIEVSTKEVSLLPAQREKLKLFEPQEDCDVSADGDEMTSLEINLQPFEIPVANPGLMNGECRRCKTNGEMTMMMACTCNDHPMLEKSAGLGACCKELLESESNNNSDDELSEFLFSMPYDAKTPCEKMERIPRERNNSDSDSDFVQIDEDSVGLGADLEQNRNDNPNRSPSIAEGFNFLGPPDDDLRDVLRGNISEEEIDSDYDLNDDTESATEDIGDDRIESDQSEVGSVNALTDVGDLSTFADIGDLPLEAGNVARNYRHRPNNRLSSVLNIVLIVVTILIMGISIGLIMATDQEMEEWHNAYLVQVKKVASLEWTLKDMDQVLQASKAAHKDDTNQFTFERNRQQIEGKTTRLETHSCDHVQKLQEMQQSLIREQERAIHWQNLYLLERRQREWERENEDFEDRRERAQWEKEDKEEDRRERERWEREEAENDRKERLQWEKEEQEEDKRDRERWEKERAEMDNLECLKKLMNTNLTLLRHQVLNWNASAFDDFVNVSMLMSGITELKQSVISSVQQIWMEAEEALNRMGRDMKKGKRSYLDTSIMVDYLKQALTIFRAQFDDVVDVNMDSLSEKVHPDISSKVGKMNYKHPQDHDSFNYRSKKREEGGMWKWNKAIGKMFKKTSKSLRKFVHTLASSWTSVKGLWDKKVSKFIDTREAGKKENIDPLPSWLPGKACRFKWSTDKLRKKPVKIGSACLWDVRDGLSKLLLEEPCNTDNHYSLSCNVNINTSRILRKDLKYVINAVENLKTIKVSWPEGREMLHLFEEFWKKWRNSELLIKFDKEWAYCQLKYWSKFVSKVVDGDVTVHHKKICGRFVDFRLILEEIKNRTIKLKDLEKKQGDYIGRGDKDEHDKDTKYFKKEKKTQYRSFITNEDGVHDRDNEYRIDHDNEIRNSKMVNKYYEDDAQEKSYFSVPTPHLSYVGKSHNNNDNRNDSNDADAGNEDEHMEQIRSSLKRAQYRIELRRAQEKAIWFFDLSEHRDNMRKEHNLEKKSAQWQFDQAKIRETLRKKYQQSDWLFDRAQYRREEFDKKWSNKFESWEGIKVPDRKRKTKDLSESEWLLQKDGAKKGRGRNSRFIKGNGRKKNGHPKSEKERIKER